MPKCLDHLTTKEVHQIFRRWLLSKYLLVEFVRQFLLERTLIKLFLICGFVNEHEQSFVMLEDEIMAEIEWCRCEEH